VKVAGATALALGLVVGLLWGAWRIDDSGPGRKTRVVETEDGEDVFVVKIEDEVGDTYVVQCDEDRYLGAHALFREHMGVDTVPLSVPGGPLAIARVPEEFPEAFRPAQRSLAEFLRRQGPGRIVLVAHDDCLVYDAIGAWQDRLAEVRASQEADLRKAAAVLGQWLPKTAVECYYASRRGDDLEFRRLPLAKEAVTR
jgi:hypothetical protein